MKRLYYGSPFSIKMEIVDSYALVSSMGNLQLYSVIKEILTVLNDMSDSDRLYLDFTRQKVRNNIVK